MQCIESYLKAIKKFKPLTAEQQLALARRMCAGDVQARDKLINSTLMLSYSIARRWYRLLKESIPLLELEDLIQEGNVGLCIAARKYTPREDVKFSSYAVHWVNAQIGRYITDMPWNIARVPNAIKAGDKNVNTYSLLSKLTTFEKNFRLQFKENPTEQDCIDYLGVTKQGMKLLRSIQRTFINPTLLDAPMDDGRNEGADGHEYYIVFHPAMYPHELTHLHILHEELTAILQRKLNSLKPRFRIILTKRFGLLGYPKETLENIGLQVGLSKEMIWMIEIAGLKHLRDLVTKEDKNKIKLIIATIEEKRSIVARTIRRSPRTRTLNSLKGKEW